MAVLHRITTKAATGGRKNGEQFGNVYLVETRDAMTEAQREAMNQEVAVITQRILHPNVVIYTVTDSIVRAPGIARKGKRDHLTSYIEDGKGTAEAPANASVAPLIICAEYWKQAGPGDGGLIQVRGIMHEGEINTNTDGELDMPTGSDLERLQLFATQIKALFENQGGRGLVLPGLEQNDDGSYPTLAQYVASARNVNDLTFDGLVYRQREKTNRTPEQDETQALRKRVSRLVKHRNEAFDQAEGGALPPEEEQSLYDEGEEIYAKYNASERNKVRIASSVKKYIRKPQ